MQKTPSALKWLVEKRGRLANDAAQTGLMAQELQQRHDKLVSKLAALDSTIQLYNEAIDPSAIAPINGWQGRYGARGALRDALLEILEKHSPAWVSSINLECLLVARFGFDFSSEADRERWRKNCLSSALHRLQTAKLVERERGPHVKAGKSCGWRLVQAAPPQSLADL